MTVEVGSDKVPADGTLSFPFVNATRRAEKVAESKEAFIIDALCMVRGAAPRQRHPAEQVALPSRVGHFDFRETGGGGARTDRNPLDLGVHCEGGERDRLG